MRDYVSHLYLRRDIISDMEKVYDHKQVESKWYLHWDKSKYFEPRPGKKHFSIILPPPNANGKLHLGHVMYVIEDIMIRHHRMLGDSTVWLPGADHAGILTHVVYERELETEGKTRYDMGSEKFYNQTNYYIHQHKEYMYKKLMAMGF